jgi:dihydroorotate dehydrogenase
MYTIVKNILFLLPAERAHQLTNTLLKYIFIIPGIKALIKYIYNVKHPALERELWGIKFPNPVGLAAGFDKNADHIHELSAFGFGFIEIGTITPESQPGNPKPRLFRLISDNALINRMGFNNDGMNVAVDKLKKRPKNLIVGGNIGKNKITPNENARYDYIKCFESLFDHVDYFVINVSSPNTPNLRELQDKKPLTEIIESLQKQNAKKNTPKPILLKIAPDLSHDQLDDILEICENTGLDGIIATNTTISRNGLNTDNVTLEKIGEGGLSGTPLKDRSTAVIRYLRDRNIQIPIIGVGGIMDEKSALEKIKAGANLIQIYSGFIFEGPGLIKRINRALISNSNDN